MIQVILQTEVLNQFTSVQLLKNIFVSAFLGEIVWESIHFITFIYN